MTASTKLTPEGDNTFPQSLGASKPALTEHGSKPDLKGERSTGLIVGIIIITVLPLLLIVAAIVESILHQGSWWHLTWIDVAIGFVFYEVSGLGVTIGYHRYFTHGAFVAHPRLRYALAIIAAMSLQGSALHWIADHRRHHAFSDKPGDPHSPWIYLKNGKKIYDNLDTDSPFRFGANLKGIVRGFCHSHLGWLTSREQTNANKYIPDLLDDETLLKVDRNFGWIVAFSIVAPAVTGGLITWSLTGAISALVWASLVRISFLHHITWSVNSICHMIGDRPFKTRDKSANFWPLAILSFGESWHNLHHADPTCARHGVLRWQLDLSAWCIRRFEKYGWATNVRWPKEKRVAKYINDGYAIKMKRAAAKLERKIALKLPKLMARDVTRAEMWATEARDHLAAKLNRKLQSDLARNMARNHVALAA